MKPPRPEGQRERQPVVACSRLMAVPHGRNESMQPHEDDATLLKQLADDIRSVADEEPEIANELRKIASELDAEMQQQNEVALRRRDFTLSTRSLSARLATGS
jgi:hypothetical protein